MKIRQNNNNDNDDDKKIKEKAEIGELNAFHHLVINLSNDGIISDLGVEFVSSFTDIRFSSCSL